MDKIALFITLFIVSIFANSQNIIEIPQMIYKDSVSGKLFVNKNQGFYLKISSSPSLSSPKHNLKTENGTVEKIYFANEGLNLLFSPTAVDTVTKKVLKPSQNVFFEVYADGTPPITKIYNNTVAYEKRDTLYFGTDLKVWFTAKDNLSGVHKIFYSINNQPFVEYKKDTLSFEDKKFYEIKYYAIDNVGNIENVKKVDFFINKDKPLTNLVVIGPHIDNIVHPTAKVALKPKDAFGFKPITRYYIDDLPNKIYTEPIIVANLSEGLHTLYYYSESVTKNIEEVKNWDFYIDKTPPMIIYELTGDFIVVKGKTYTTPRTLVQLTAIDNKAGVKSLKYSFDGKDWFEYTAPFQLPLDKKNLNIYYYAEDNVGNKTSKNIQEMQTGQKFLISEMDLTPPDIKLNFIGPTFYKFDTLIISNKTFLKITAFDNQSGLKSIEYEYNNNEPTTYSKEFQISEQGLINLNITAIDNVNNISTTNKFFVVDTSGPQIFIHFSFEAQRNADKIILPRNSKIFLAATDKFSGVESISYKINNSNFVIYNDCIVLDKSGNYVLVVMAKDLLGNRTIEKFEFEIK